jgi:hypothetical protein
MPIKIDEEIIKKALKCKKEQACLNNEEHKCCKVTNSVQDSVCFVDREQWDNCGYLMPFGYSDVCNCPVRTEIYKQYKK